MNKPTVYIIGAGVGGLATAIRLACKGYAVTVYEKNNYAGGKLSQMQLGKYRFDKGPSLFTMPNLVNELKELVQSKSEFNYTQLDTITHYFYDDGTTVNASANTKDFANELHIKLNEDKQAVMQHLAKSKYYYDTTAELFLQQSLSQFKNFISIKTVKGILRSPKLKLLTTMHEQNARMFKNPKTVQLFDRYATYNGSNPYKAPALLNIIAHLEFGMGAFIPENGMHQITNFLLKLASEAGVSIELNCDVQSIIITNNKATGLVVNNEQKMCNLVVSDVDIHLLYTKLLPLNYYPKKLLSQEKSSSAFVFYWGINNKYAQLGLHNILFSANYKAEFEQLFNSTTPYHDPTVYINITSKYCKNDAPNGCENWFVMVNVPHNTTNNITYANQLRSNIINKINKTLNTTIQDYIVEESSLSPLDIELQTSSYGGSLYGNSSNNKFSAFMRHANFSSKIKNLYLVGGSVHPGGGIPLCLLSAKIASSIIKDKHACN
jgi:phytoene desaturase